MPYRFNGNDTHTLGVEIELQLVDAETGALSNSILPFLDRVPTHWRSAIKPEFMQSFCEFNTGICRTVSDVRRDLTEKLQWAHEHAAQMGLRFAWSGSHPFSRWEDQRITPGQRYQWLADTMQFVARRLVVFGLHVHVGVNSGDKAVQMCDRLLRHLPTLLALSANSPLWHGMDTGIESYRSKVMEALPTAGMPHPLRNWSEYVWLANNLIQTGFIESIREIWWDVRPHGGFGTVELRIMDQPVCMKHLLGLTALSQSLVAGISADIDRGAYLYDSHPLIAKHNKWHAARYGMDATFVDFDTMAAAPARDIVRRLVDRCQPYAEELGCLEELGYLDDIIDNGTGATRQRRIWHETGDLTAVVHYLVQQGQTAV